ncbi:MAG: hypothetical protein NVV73_16475 [Cellvibrionaceae bacterium]|nr:hypothetical protein [Cellvibrionaceae bacterium]
MEFIVAAAVGIFLVALLLFLYFYYADNTLDLLGAPVDWSDFATFFGGVLGPLVLWVFLFLLLYLLRQQKSELVNAVRESRAQDRLRCLQQFENEIAPILRREFATADATRRVEFADYIEGVFPFPKVPDTYFKASLEKLLRVTANYCEAIGAYRADLHDNFLFDIHETRARDLVACLDKLREHLSPMARQALSFCKAHLDEKKDSRAQMKSAATAA